MHDPIEDTTSSDVSIEHFEIHQYTAEEAREYFDAMAKFHLNISGDEFRKRWHRGDYDDDPDRPDVMTVAMCLPMVEQEVIKR